MPAKSSLPSVLDLKSVLENHDVAALRIEISLGARAPIVNGQPTIVALWRADIYSVPVLPRKRPERVSPPIVDEESPAALLRQLADIYEAGALDIRQINT
jgi:hypothetical protein